MIKPSERVNNCGKTGRSLQASIETNGEKAAVLAGEQFGGKLSEKVLKMVFAGLSWLIEDATEKLLATELNYTKEQSEDSQARAIRDNQIDILTGALARVRSRLNGLGGDALLKRCQLPGSLPTQPQRLLNLSRNVCQAIKGLEKPIEDEMDGTILEPKKIAQFLEKKVEALDKSLEGVEWDKRETQDALITRDTALTRWARVYRAVSAMTEGLYRLAGMDEAAERIRYRTRRRNGAEAPTPEQDTPNPPTS